MLGDDDLCKIIKRLTGVEENITEGLTDAEVQSLIQHVSVCWHSVGCSLCFISFMLHFLFDLRLFPFKFSLQ